MNGRERHSYILEVQSKIRGTNKRLVDTFSDEEILKPKGVADRIAGELKDNLKSTQLRKVFSKIKEIESRLNEGKDYKLKILELYPSLAYSTGRNLMPRRFYELLVLLLEKAERDKDDARMVIKLITAIVAYSKLHSKNNGR